MIRKKKDEIEWLEFELLANFPRLKHAVFLRHGGVSQGLYESLNLSYGVGDEIKNVDINQTKTAAILEVPKWHSCKQQHGSHIEILSKENQHPLFGDGLATTELNRGLMIHHADCQAAIFYDPIQHATAVVHSGWRGSVQNIYHNAISLMKTSFHSNPSNIFVAISPSLGPQSAEFIHYQQELPPSFWDYQITPNHFDFWAISEMQLKNSGIPKEHIQIAQIDTKTNPHDYFSYRHTKIRGGHGTTVSLI